MNNEEKILQILTSMQTTQRSMQSQLNEHGEILRALEHKTDIIKAEQENMKHDVADLSGNLKSVAKDLNRIEIHTAENWRDIAYLKSVK